MRSVQESADETALDELIARYGGRVKTYLAHLLRDPTWADDLTQEVFLRVYERANTYDPRWSFSVWLFRIARNLAVDLLRREKVHRRTVESVKEGVTPAPEGPPSEDTASPLQRLERRELNEQFQRALRRLPEVFRSVFVLKEIEGMSYEEIATVIGAPVKTVSSRLHRARGHLRRLLSPYLELDPHAAGGKS